MDNEGYAEIASIAQSPNFEGATTSDIIAATLVDDEGKQLLDPMFESAFSYINMKCVHPLHIFVPAQCYTSQ